MSSTSKKIIPVVIPYFRAPEALELTVDAISKQELVKTLIYIRDNSEDNILFTKAVNEGLRKFSFSSDYDYILVLNHDAILHPRAIKQLVDVMENDSKIGITAPVALSRDKSINWCGSAQALPWGSHLSCNLSDLPTLPFETHWVNGASMLLRTSMIRDIGMLDENMQFVCSDADYSFTARSRGWRCNVVPTAFVQHELSGSSETSDQWLSSVKLDDQLFFLRKWVTGGLYKALALEGPNLTPESIAMMEKETLRRIKLLQEINPRK